MDRRRIELQLRMLRTLLRAERQRGDPEALAGFVERARPIVEGVTLIVDEDSDPELVELLDTVRAEMDSARSS